MLAKELGVESKAILQKLKGEGLSDAAPNHMSTLSLGLAESVREWFSSGQLGGGGTAVETAPHVEVAKTKAAPRQEERGRCRAARSRDRRRSQSAGPVHSRAGCRRQLLPVREAEPEIETPVAPKRRR